MSNKIELMDSLRAKLAEVQEITQALTEQEVTLVFSLGSEHKTVQLKTQKTFEITVVGTTNQDI